MLLVSFPPDLGYDRMPQPSIVLPVAAEKKIKKKNMVNRAEQIDPSIHSMFLRLERYIEGNEFFLHLT